MDKSLRATIQGIAVELDTTNKRVDQMCIRLNNVEDFQKGLQGPVENIELKQIEQDKEIENIQSSIQENSQSIDARVKKFIEREHAIVNRSVLEISHNNTTSIDRLRKIVAEHSEILQTQDTSKPATSGTSIRNMETQRPCGTPERIDLSMILMKMTAVIILAIHIRSPGTILQNQAIEVT